MNLWKYLAHWWDARRRRIDLQVLWPACKRAAQRDCPEGATKEYVLEVARQAFIQHMSFDYQGAWKNAAKWTPEELGDFVRKELV
jgi:hypothetical protein